jgi:hypothetical protein
MDGTLSEKRVLVVRVQVCAALSVAIIAHTLGFRNSFAWHNNSC